MFRKIDTQFKMLKIGSKSMRLLAVRLILSDWITLILNGLWFSNGAVYIATENLQHKQPSYIRS